jgi:GNAT superfamily N-acetyltransferase
VAITIRRANSADTTRLAELRYEFRAERAETTELRDNFLRRCGEWMERRLAGNTWRCWVAVRGQTIVGHLWLQLIEKIPNPIAEAEWHAYITNMYVQEAERGGVGSALLQEALDWCCTQDIDYIVLWPTTRSRTLYAREGFAATDAVVARSFADPR